MKYAVEMGSGAKMCVPSFIMIDSGIRKFMRGDTRRHRHTECKVVS
jgi:hypothetical protein